jgi:PPK2 family polyphosphate:nucleotide phosphotransferase
MDLDFTDNFLVDKTISLNEFDTAYTGKLSKQKGLQMLVKSKERLYELQEKLYADAGQSLLVVLQAMDGAGKDSLIEHVFSGINPQGCEVKSFKTPTSLDYSHDFLWRHNLYLPEKGKIAIFNRSHYESVLVCKVHPEYNLKERTWDSVADFDATFWKHRYESINDFEKHLTRNGTKIVKLFLHVSEKEQRKRFLDRINEEDKNWKFSSADMSERALWDHYQKVYEDAINETSTGHARWYVVPSDNKWFTRLAAIQLIVQALESMHLKYPELPADEIEKLEQAKRELTKK